MPRYFAHSRDRYSHHVNNRHDDFWEESEKATAVVPPRNKSAKTVFLGMIFAKSDIFAWQWVINHRLPA